MSSIGGVSDSTPILANPVPYIEINYPMPYILKDYSKKDTRQTTNDIIKVGLNIYSTISEIRMRNNQDETIMDSEVNELVEILTSGVIYNGSS